MSKLTEIKNMLKKAENEFADTDPYHQMKKMQNNPEYHVKNIINRLQGIDFSNKESLRSGLTQAKEGIEYILGKIGGEVKF